MSKNNAPVNPKQIHGDRKVPLQLLPPLALIECAAAMGEGARKYGAWNWHENEVEYMTYVGAMWRHIIDGICGITRDKDSKVHPLGHVMACCAILMDAEATGQLVDNRPKLDANAVERMQELMLMMTSTE